MDIVQELTKIANELDAKGLHKEADELDGIIKEACDYSKILTDAHTEKNKNIVPGSGEGGIVENLIERQDKICDVAKKQPTGKQGSVKADIVVAEKEVPFPMYGPTQVQSRYCPDHPGVMVSPAGERKVQCPLDGKIYDYAEGFKYDGGKTMPGASLAHQTPEDASYYQAPHRIFEKE